jgi:predicted flap endonuclease-1-like 5' DNA nuclease
MNLQKLVDELDGMVLAGDFAGAVERFFAPDALFIGGPEDVRHGVVEKTKSLHHFAQSVRSIDAINRHGVATTAGTSYSEFTFRFTQHSGQQLIWNEVIRRRWDDDKVTEEKYFIGHPTGDPERPFGKEAQEAQTLTTLAIITETNHEEEAPAAKAKAKPKKAAAKADNAADDLTKVEGIGPKINGILNEAGIFTFAQLAAADPAKLKQLLDAAGPRYRMHDPASWPAQSAMAAAGQWEQLKAWQAEHQRGKA